MKKTAGYVVVDNGGVKRLLNDVLWITDSTGTLFATRKDAKKAIARTKTYQDKHQYEWDVEFWWIVRMVNS